VGKGDLYQLTPNENWLAGFWTGLLWLAFSAAGDEDLCAQAKGLLPSFRDRLDCRIHITHDLGFLFTLSARAQWELTGDASARLLALRAAKELVQRYREPGRYIQAWGDVGDPAEGGRTIIDALMNLPLLFWASKETGDLRFHQAAREHALTSLRWLLRPDGASYHTYFFDQESGEPLAPRTHQGYADDSLWARGQAWAIYGFAVAAEWCQEQRFLDASYLAAERFMTEMPSDGVPTWDLRLPTSAPHYRDSSAGAIAAAGMLRLVRLDAGGRASERRAWAHMLLESLVARCFEADSRAQYLLRDATVHALKGWGIEEPFICGDYFFLEALLMLEGRAPDFWGLESPM
jgi:unsaturated chondroitin disaccharide hydrolase